MIVDQLYTLPEPTVHGTRIFTEGRHKKLLKEDATYRKFHNLSRMLAERAMTEKEILDLFAAVEAGANAAAGGNRTALGKGKDAVAGAYNSAKDAIGGILNSIQMSTPVAGVDAAYNDATDALGKALGGSNSKIMDSIKKYRLLAKEYPKTQLFVKTALIALAGIATGGAGLVAIAGVTAAVDAAIKGEKLSSLIGKGAGAALMAYGAQEVAAALGSNAPVAADDGTTAGIQAQINAQNVPAGVNGGGTYTVMSGDQGGFIAQAQGVPFKDLQAMNPDITNWNKLPVGTELQLPPSGPNTGSVWQGTDMSAPGVAPDSPGPGPGPNDTVTPPAVTNQPAVQFTNGNEGTLTLPDGRELRAIAFPPEGIQPRITGEPVTVTYGGQSVKAYIKGDIAYFTRFDPNAGLGLQESWLPAVKLLKLPAAQLIDHKLTVMGWALNESIGKKPGNSVHLTRKGVFTVIENVDRYRCALLKEYQTGPGREALPDLYRPDQPGAPAPVTAKPGMVGRGLNWLDKTAGKVGGYLSKQAQNFTRKVTAAKLKMEWQQLGHPSDSDQIAAFLAKQGVPQPVITDVYSKMGIPVNDVAGSQAGGSGIQTGATSLIDPETGRPYEKSKLAAYRNPVAGATPAATKTHTGGRVAGAGLSMTPNAIRKRDARTAAATTASGAAGAGAFGQMASQLAGKQPNTMANTTVSKTNTAKPGNPNNAGAGAFGQMGTQLAKGSTTAPVANFGNTNFSSYKQPGASTTAPGTTSFKPPSTAPVAPGNQKLTPDEYIKRIGAPATAETIKQVKKMLETMQTRDDVNFIKKYINHEFDRQGMVNELSIAQRNHLIERVTQIAAVRRRDHAKLLA